MQNVECRKHLGFTNKFLLAAILGCGHASNVSAQLLFQHNGAANPETEGWSRLGPDVDEADVTYGPVLNDPGYGANAWFVRDQSSEGGSYVQYEAALNSTQAADANTIGWRFRTTLRVVNSPDPPDFGLYFQLCTGATGYSAVFGSQADGDPIVQFVTDVSVHPPVGPTFALEGGGPGYHTYECVYSPASGSASLYVDGIERLANYGGHPGSGTLVSWGAGGSLAQGWGNFRLAQFEIDRDSDGDSLLDSWETNGIPYSKSDGTIGNYVLLGANPSCKDIYVEIDSMPGREPSPYSDAALSTAIAAVGLIPTQTCLDRVVGAFLAAPVSPPVGVPNGIGGIALHLVIDETLPTLRDYPNGFSEFDQDKTTGNPTVPGDVGHFGTTAGTERGDVLNWPQIRQAKANAYRYCIFANTHDGGPSSGVAEGLLCNDFMVTLGGIDTTTGLPVFPKAANIPGGTGEDQAGTFMHELGHSLGLDHGGNDPINWKPNYYSVMNYWWQTPNPSVNPIGHWELRFASATDYTSVGPPLISELQLNESLGVSMNFPGRSVPFSIPVGTGNCANTSTVTCMGRERENRTKRARSKIAIYWLGICLAAPVQ